MAFCGQYLTYECSGIRMDDREFRRISYAQSGCIDKSLNILARRVLGEKSLIESNSIFHSGQCVY